MAARKRVLVYGGSLNLAGLTACLKLDRNLDVFTLHPGDLHARQCLEEFDPQTIIFDLIDPSTDVNLDLLKSQPGTLLIGVDPSSDDVLVLTGKRSRVVTASELTRLVSNHSDQAQARDDLFGDDEGGAPGATH